MKVQHLIAALVACVILVSGLGGGILYAQSVEDRYVHALAPMHAPLNITGSALQQAALRQPDLLPIYGASEVLSQPSPYQASRFFQTYPTGFETFEVSKGGLPFLIIAQQIAALGPELRGKKVVLSYAPSSLLIRMANPTAYANMFSRLHANELAFSDQLSFDTKRLAALRMLQYPKTLDKDPILRFALQNLASSQPLSGMLYYAVWPLGKLQTFILELQDHFRTVTYIQSQKRLNPVVNRKAAKINWQAVAARARREQIPYSNNNPYGFDDNIWRKNFNAKWKPRPAGSADQGYLNAMLNSEEWVDFNIVLRILHDMGAQPLILGRPIKTAYMEATGVSWTAQQVFYDRMQQVAQLYGFPLVDFENFANDLYFGVDPVPHTSREGWVYVDQVLDEYYHGHLGTSSRSINRTGAMLSGHFAGAHRDVRPG